MAVMVLMVMAALYAAHSYIAKIEPTTPSVDDLLDARGAKPSVLLSANGTHLATFSRGQQEQVRLEQISPEVIRAVVATEDHRFYDHPGVDIIRTVSAVIHTLRGDAQGGSTINQQLVRNMFPEEIGRSRTIDRKVREIITALKIEKSYTKDEILETYLNSVPFLYNVVGIQMAARTYYNKSAAELDTLEAATLVGMLKGTSYYNPVLNPERAQKRRNVVLGQMAKHQLIDPARLDSLRATPLKVTLTRQVEPPGSAPHFAGYARRQLLAWAEENDYNIFTDGLIVHSTLDDQLQAVAAQAVERQAEVLQTIADVEWAQKNNRVSSHVPSAYAALRKKVEPFSHFWTERADLLDAFVRETPEYRKAVTAGENAEAVLAKLKGNAKFMAALRENKTRLEAGFVAMDPTTGEVKAWIGSRNFETDQFDHVAQAERQPGSTFKPLVYGAAMESGMGPERAYPDGQVTIRTADGGVWRPTDMSGFSGRMMSMREGLIFSKNTITAQVMQDVGVQQVVDLARAVGVRQSQLVPVPSLSLGTSPVTLLEMVSAYSTIAHIGEYRAPVAIKRITDRDGNVLAEFNSQPSPAMSEITAIELIDMMRGVVRRGTGNDMRNRFNLVADLAGKTGTTQNNTDGWFILMHPNLVAGAWVGFNDARVTMRSDYWGQGGHNAGLLVGDFFRDTLKEKRINAKAKFPQPKRPPPLLVKAPQEWVRRVDDSVANVPPGYGVITRRDTGGTTIIGPEGTIDVRTSGINPAASGTTDPIGRFVNGVAGTPAGTRVESSGSSGGADGRSSGGISIDLTGQ